MCAVCGCSSPLYMPRPQGRRAADDIHYRAFAPAPDHQHDHGAPEARVPAAQPTLRTPTGELAAAKTIAYEWLRAQKTAGREAILV